MATSLDVAAVGGEIQTPRLRVCINRQPRSESQSKPESFFIDSKNSKRPCPRLERR